MAKEKSQAEFLAEEIKKAISKAKRESADVESPESLLAVEGEIRQSLLSIQKDALQKLKAGDERHDQIEKLLASENKRLATLASDFKKNEEFEKRIRTNIATSRAASARAAAETDDFSQKTATLSAKDLQVKGDSGLTRLIQNYAEEMASAITQMRALGLPAKKFTKNTLEILDGFKKSIDADPALNGESLSDAAEEAKQKILAVWREHVGNVTEAGSLSPLALLGKNLAGGLKEKVASAIKAIPGMGAMDTMAGLMGLRPISERIDETITGKSDITREGDAGVADIKSEAALAVARGQEEYSWSGLNTDTVARSQVEGDAARVAAGVIGENIRDEGTGRFTESPRRVRDRPEEGVTLTPEHGGMSSMADMRQLLTKDSPVGQLLSEDSPVCCGDEEVVPTLKSIENILESTLGVAAAAEKREVEEAQDAAEPKTEAEKHRGSIEDDAAQFLGLGKEEEKGGNIIIAGLKKVGRGLFSFATALLPVAGLIAGPLVMAFAVLDTALDAFAGNKKYIDEGLRTLAAEAAEHLDIPPVDPVTGIPLTQDELAIASANQLISEQEENQDPKFQEAMEAANLTGNTMLGLGAPKLDPEAGPTADQSYELLKQLQKQRGQDDAEARHLVERRQGLVGPEEGPEYKLTKKERGFARGHYALGLKFGYGDVPIGASIGTGAVGSNRRQTFGGGGSEAPQNRTVAPAPFGDEVWVRDGDSPARSGGSPAPGYRPGVVRGSNYDDVMDSSPPGGDGGALTAPLPDILKLEEQSVPEGFRRNPSSATPASAPSTDSSGDGVLTPPVRYPVGSHTGPFSGYTITPSADTSDDTAVPIDPSVAPDPDADDLRIKNVMVDGVREATGGGETQPGVRKLASLVQGELGNTFTQVTGFNDIFHQDRLKNDKIDSLHTEGLAADFTVGNSSRSAAAAQTVRRIARDHGATVYVKDEYKTRSAGASGDHIHFQFDSNSDAAKMLSAGKGGPEYGGHSAAALSSSWPAASRSGAGVVAATARQASQTAAAPSDAAKMLSAGKGGPEYGGRSAPALSSSWPAASRSGAGVAAATARQASQTAAAPVIVANIGGRPAPAAPSVTTMYPIPIPINPHNEDQTLRGIVAIGGGTYA